MVQLGLKKEVVDPEVLERTIQRFRKRKIRLPTFKELANPRNIPQHITNLLKDVDPDKPDPLNLFRVHWYNDGKGGSLETPQYIELPKELTGVDAENRILRGTDPKEAYSGFQGLEPAGFRQRGRVVLEDAVQHYLR